MYDTTGEVVRDETVPNSTNCTTFSPQEVNIECTPIDISVKANTSSGHATKNITLRERIHTENNAKCDCIRENGISFCRPISD